MPIVGLPDCRAKHIDATFQCGEVASQKLRDAFDAFSCTVKEMSIVRAYCVRSSESTTCQTCQQTKLPQKLLQEFVSKHQVAYVASWHASELELDPEGVFTVKDFALTNATAFFWNLSVKSSTARSPVEIWQGSCQCCHPFQKDLDA